jgi:hypothetical protein
LTHRVRRLVKLSCSLNSGFNCGRIMIGTNTWLALPKSTP